MRSLLAQSALPSEDLCAGLLETFRLAVLGDAVIGAVGLERAGSDGLLRSLVVEPAWRRHGVGESLVGQAEGLARTLGLAQLFLLTTTARAFFARLAYEAVPRDRAPPAIRATAEFRGLCPTSAVLMRKPL